MSYWYYAHVVLIQATLVSLLLVLSLQIPLRFGVFSFAGAGSYAIGGYATAISEVRFHQSVWSGVLEGMVLASAAGYLLALLLHRLGALYLGMATIVFDLIIAVLVTNGGSLTGGATGLYGVLDDVTTFQIAAVTLAIIGMIAWSERGAVGRRIEAVREDPELSGSVGINVRGLRRSAFVVSGAIGALAGGINVALRTTISPGDIGLPLVVVTLTMILVGGTRSWLGAAIGAVFFTWLPTVLAFVGDWKAVTYGVIVAIAAVWLPGGVVGVATDGLRAFRGRRHIDAWIESKGVAPHVVTQAPRAHLNTLEASPSMEDML